jgi:hypothetical protein
MSLRSMELAGAPLGKDLLGGLGEHLCEARENLLRGLGQRTLGAVEDGLGVAGDRGAAGDGGGGTPEWPGRVGVRALRLAWPATERRRRHASE